MTFQSILLHANMEEINKELSYNTEQTPTTQNETPDIHSNETQIYSIIERKSEIVWE